MEQMLGQLTTAIKSLSDIGAWTVISLLAAAGTIAMAILQLIKDLTPIRTWYQRQWIEAWIESKLQRIKGSSGRGLSAAGAKDLLVELSTGGDERALFELATEQLVAQINAAARFALDYPKKYTDLLVVVSSGVDASDLAAVLAGSGAGKREGPSQGYLDARNRVANRIQRNLDGMQISLASRWRLWMQIVAIVLTVLVVELALILSTGNAGLSSILLAIPIGIVGGYIAPVTRDIVSALQSLRK